MNIDMAIERLESNSIEISFSEEAQYALRNLSKLTDFEIFTLEQKLQSQSAQQFTLTYFVSDVILFRLFSAGNNYVYCLCTGVYNS